MRGEKWLDWAAYGTWIVVALPVIADIANGELEPWQALGWAVAFATFGAAYTVCAAGRPRKRPALVVPLLAVQTIAGLAMIVFGQDGTEGAVLVIVAAEAAAILPAWGAWMWVAGQSILLGAIFWAFNGWIEAVTGAGAFAGFQAFAMTAMWLARSERATRMELARANAELVATQSLLAENSRVAERLRISRDLHDTLGHHLTALSLQLDVASRLASGQAAEHVREAHAITRLLLGDVRNVVSEMRESQLDLAHALRALAAGTPVPLIHLDIPAPFLIDDAGQAHALLRSVQEIITNASRHGGAHNLWIRVERRADGIHLQARDDGRGAAQLTWGNGLTGMRERFEECSGRVEFTPGPGQGFEVHGFMPRPGTAP